MNELKSLMLRKEWLQFEIEVRTGVNVGVVDNPYRGKYIKIDGVDIILEAFYDGKIFTKLGA